MKNNPKVYLGSFNKVGVAVFVGVKVSVGVKVGVGVEVRVLVKVAVGEGNIYPSMIGHLVERKRR